MISYIDEYNDNVEKQCIIKNNKNKKKQRNGLLNPNLKFSSSLNAFIPPPNSDSPKINKSDFINIIKSSFKTLGKDPPADEELEDIFMNMSELDILEFNNNLTEIDIAEFNIDMPLQVGVDVQQGFYNPESLMGMSVEAQKSRQKMLRAEEILREFYTMEGFNNDMPLRVGVDVDQGFYNPESLMGMSVGAATSKSMLSRTAQLISDFDARDARDMMSRPEQLLRDFDAREGYSSVPSSLGSIFRNEYPELGLEPIYGLVSGTKNTKAELEQLETERRRKEANEGRPVEAVMTGQSGRPISVELESVPIPFRP